MFIITFATKFKKQRPMLVDVIPWIDRVMRITISSISDHRLSLHLSCEDIENLKRELLRKAQGNIDVKGEYYDSVFLYRVYDEDPSEIGEWVGFDIDYKLTNPRIALDYNGNEELVFEEIIITDLEVSFHLEGMLMWDMVLETELPRIVSYDCA